MPEPKWQKSSYSGSGQNDCVEVAAAGNRSVRLRESDAPAHVLAPSPAALHGLLAHLKAGGARIR